MKSNTTKEFEALAKNELKKPANGMPFMCDMRRREPFASELDTAEKVRDLAVNILGSLDHDKNFLLKRLEWMERFEPFSGMPEVIEQLRKEVLKDEG